MSDLAAISDERVAELAREILARADYARFRSFDAESLREWLEWLGDWFDGLQGLAVSSPFLYAALIAGLLLVALLLLAHVTLSIAVALRTAPPPARPPAETAPPLELEAERLAARGQHLDAAHVMHLACLRQLLDRGELRLRRHEPNPVLRARLAAAALPDAERSELLALLDRLERRWFRDRDESADDRALYEAWRTLRERLEATVPRATSTPPPLRVAPQ